MALHENITRLKCNSKSIFILVICVGGLFKHVVSWYKLQNIDIEIFEKTSNSTKPVLVLDYFFNGNKFLKSNG